MSACFTIDFKEKSYLDYKHIQLKPKRKKHG